MTRFNVASLAAHFNKFDVDATHMLFWWSHYIVCCAVILTVDRERQQYSVPPVTATKQPVDLLDEFAKQLMDRNKKHPPKVRSPSPPRSRTKSRSKSRPRSQRCACHYGFWRSQDL